MGAEIFRHYAVGADPDLTRWFCNVSFQRVMEFDRANLQRFIAEKFLFDLRRQQVGQLAGNIRFGGKRVRSGCRWHSFLMFIAGFWRLERGGHIENGLPVLNRRHPAGAEAIAIAQDFNIIDDRFQAIAGTQEVAVKRVNQAF